MVGAADIVLALVDPTRSPAEAQQMLASLTARLDCSSQILLVLVNKMDLNKNVKDINNFVSSVDNYGDVVLISALSGEGLDELRSTLVRKVEQRLPGNSDAVLVTNARHHEALRHTAESLDTTLCALDAGTPSDLVAQDLRAALHYLGTITGAVTTDEVLGEIFSRFCIGK
jgi:tRNA modification GTPase